MARYGQWIGSIRLFERPYRPQYVANDVDQRRGGGFDDAVDFPEQAIGEVEDLSEIGQRGGRSALTDLFDEQFAITFDCVERRAQRVAKPGGLIRATRRRI